MKLTKEEVKKIADLARLEISDEKLEYYTEELSAVLDYVEQLNELDTEDVEPMAQATELYTVYREDIQAPGERSNLVKKLMSAASMIKGGFISVRSVFNKKD
ncbi:MAG: Asp-tRNA(Asn)/Glu-tRNA(Gln) amidotransferase subunit GatC [Candidatus Spechtbacterales bacterium]|nr:Asp-tRNA(Asn)/Glu-tRNA(Gln) amidotransferase subunit GatC [Candidatus Spechtbacterales bacterium]